MLILNIYIYKYYLERLHRVPPVCVPSIRPAACNEPFIPLDGDVCLLINIMPGHALARLKFQLLFIPSPIYIYIFKKCLVCLEPVLCCEIKVFLKI